MAERIGYFGPGLMGRGIIKTLLGEGLPRHHFRPP